MAKGNTRMVGCPLSTCDGEVQVWLTWDSVAEAYFAISGGRCSNNDGLTSGDMEHCEEIAVAEQEEEDAEEVED